MSYVLRSGLASREVYSWIPAIPMEFLRFVSWHPDFEGLAAIPHPSSQSDLYPSWAKTLGISQDREFMFTVMINDEIEIHEDTMDVPAFADLDMLETWFSENYGTGEDHTCSAERLLYIKEVGSNQIVFNYIETNLPADDLNTRVNREGVMDNSILPLKWCTTAESETTSRASWEEEPARYVEPQLYLLEGCTSCAPFQLTRVFEDFYQVEEIDFDAVFTHISSNIWDDESSNYFLEALENFISSVGSDLLDNELSELAPKFSDSEIVTRMIQSAKTE